MIYGIYRLLTRLLFILVFPVFLVYASLTGKHRKGLRQRLGYYQENSLKSHGKPVIWLHAASVGEIKATGILVAGLLAEFPLATLVVTTMTEQGLKMARRQLNGRAEVLLAPLDLPGAVERAINLIQPDIYLCLETELWPNMLTTLKRRGTDCFLLNARMSEKSYRRYRRLQSFSRLVLSCFANISAISTVDAERFAALGVREEKIRVCGNVKYDLPAPSTPGKTRQEWRKTMGLSEDTLVLVAGSTHGNEELQLLEVFGGLKKDLPDSVLIMAPRHLDRLPELEAQLKAAGVGFDLLSRMKKEGRRQDVILVDTMGDLTSIYAVATFIFCGGSLVDRGGHNIMEAAAWGRPVLYGPSMKDFADAMELLELGGGGFRVTDGSEMLAVIRQMLSNPDAYRQASEGAGRTAESQNGSAALQLQPVFSTIRRLWPDELNKAGRNPGQA